MMPAMAVPWRAHASSPSRAPKPTRSLPSRTLPSRSGWSASTPVSRTATVTPAPRVVGQIWSVCRASRAHCRSRMASACAVVVGTSTRAAASRPPSAAGRFLMKDAPWGAGPLAQGAFEAVGETDGLVAQARLGGGGGGSGPHGVLGGLRLVDGTAVGPAGDGVDDDGGVGEHGDRPGGPLLGAESLGRGPLRPVRERHQVAAAVQPFPVEAAGEGLHARPRRPR